MIFAAGLLGKSRLALQPAASLQGDGVGTAPTVMSSECQMKSVPYVLVRSCARRQLSHYTA